MGHEDLPDAADIADAFYALVLPQVDAQAFRRLNILVPLEISPPAAKDAAIDYRLEALWVDDATRDAAWRELEEM